MKISLIIPAYNEEKQILKTLTETIEYMEKELPSYEIIVVNDGSRDKTAEMTRALSPFVRLISYDKNMGKGYAVSRGVESAKGEYIFFTDADLSYDLQYIKQGERLLDQGAEVVIGERNRCRTGYPFLRREISKIYGYAVNRLFPLEIEDTQCGFKGFKGSVAKRLFNDLKTDGFGFDTEILCKASLFNMEIAQMPVDFVHRENSKVSILSGARTIRDLYKIRRELLENLDKG